MSDSAIIYTALFLGFIFLLLFIRRFPFAKKSEGNNVLMYYKLELPENKITTITAINLEQDSKLLNSSGYELVFLSDLEEYTRHEVKLPNSSFLIAANESYSNLLKVALPSLVHNKINLVIFIPILLIPSNETHSEKQVQQLNEFIFSEEFKNIFGYTQPIR
ncbi:MAG: hypothetical protein IPL97_14195 [Niastella sp.]|nr:hypothetical protein [Niastella sp.]